MSFGKNFGCFQLERNTEYIWSEWRFFLSKRVFLTVFSSPTGTAWPCPCSRYLYHEPRKERVSTAVISAHRPLGHLPAFALHCAVGRQRVLSRPAGTHLLRAVPQLLSVHQVRVHTYTRVLRPSRGLQASNEKVPSTHKYEQFYLI